MPDRSLSSPNEVSRWELRRETDGMVLVALMAPRGLPPTWHFAPGAAPSGLVRWYEQDEPRGEAFRYA